MKISVDGGALNPENDQRFGTAVFSENIVSALKLYDKNNQYFIYTFENLKPKLFWMKGRVSLEEFKQKKDIFLALNQAVPLYTSGKIISFCHGLSYYFYPQFYSKKDYIRLNKQLNEMIKRSDYIVVSSEKIKKELILIYRYIERKIVVIPFGIPLEMMDKPTFAKASHFAPGASRDKSVGKGKYFIFVGMDHKIKNIEFIKKAFRKFRELKEFRSYKLILVTENCSRKKLRLLYKNATALLTASHYESFNFPVLEALSQGCPVIGLSSAIIPEFISYVNSANNVEEFVEKMKKISKKPSTQSINQLHKKFNWKNYVKNLVKLYK